MLSGRHQHAHAASGKGVADVDTIAVSGNSQGVGRIRTPLLFALGMCAGVVGYFSLPFEPARWHVATIVVFALLSWWILRKYSLEVLPRGLIAVVLGASFGLAIIKTHTDFKTAPALTASLGPVMIEGWITNVEPGKNGDRLRIRLHSVAKQSTDTMPRSVRLTHSNSLEVEPGRFVRCFAVLRPPPQPEFPGDYPFNRQAFFEGLDAVGYVMGRCRGGALGPNRDAVAAFDVHVGGWRRALSRHVQSSAGEKAGGFAAALTSGDRSFMSQADMEALRQSGLAHLLAISGLHLGIVGALVFFGVRRSLAAWEWLALRIPVQKPAAAFGIISTAAYLVLSGASISTQRAFIMASIAFLAILFDRSPFSFRTFSVAMMTVIILHPASVMTPGFQMSFAATGALIATYEAWSRRDAVRGNTKRRGIGFAIKSLCVTSLVGAAATAPFALYHFDRVAPLGLFANLLAMPIFTFISAPAAALSLVLWPVGLSDTALAVFGWSLERVLAIAHWTAGDGSTGLEIGEPLPATVLILMTLGLIYSCLLSGWRRRGAAVVLLAAMCVPATALAPDVVLHWSSSGDAYVMERREGVQRLAMSKGEGLAPLHYADLHRSTNCRVSGCAVDTSAGRVLLGTSNWLSQNCDQSTSVLLSLSGTDIACASNPHITTWKDVARGGAVTLLRSVNGELIERRPKCGHRPWTPCLDQANLD